MSRTGNFYWSLLEAAMVCDNPLRIDDVARMGRDAWEDFLERRYEVVRVRAIQGRSA